MKKRNELVRDRVPEIIEQSGKRCVVTVLEQDEYLKMLEEKLQEMCLNTQRVNLL